MASDTSPGWYGKLSGLGDFASRRLDAEWVRSCDQWLSEGLRDSQHALGDRWLELYLAAPIWRFAWAPGVIDQRWWFGLLMPSCDSVGRYFPLLIAQSRPQPPADRFALDHLELWWESLTRSAMATLDPATTVDAFEAALQEAPPWATATGRTLLTPTSAYRRERYQTAAGTSLHDVLGELAGQRLLQSLQGVTMWWPVNHPGEPGALTLHSGLPSGPAFAALVNGQW
jgi:type VI secretion system protein ImpM